METSNVEIIKDAEGLRLDAYLPTPNDVWTIGYGHTKGVKQGDSITELQAEGFLYEDLAWAEEAVNNYVKAKLNQNQFDALVSFVFNIGATAFRKSTLLRKLNTGDYEGAANEFPRWNKQKGKVLRGLVRRRAKEMELFLSAAIVETAKSEPVEEPDPLKSLSQSKEVFAGVVGLVSGTTATLSDMSTSDKLIFGGLLLAVGAFVLVNRLLARQKGQR